MIKYIHYIGMLTLIIIYYIYRYMYVCQSDMINHIKNSDMNNLHRVKKNCINTSIS